MFRDFQITKLITNAYLVGVIFYIFTLYSAMLVLTLIMPYSDEYQLETYSLWVALQMSFIMVIWSMIRCVISDPGKVPIYWGVLLDDQEQKKRRYCLICHIFKPERCHHCSNCQRCVLNMDHHCPWIGNCVGYQNRKFFILFLFYINVTVLICIPTLILKLIPIFQDLLVDWKIILEDYRIVLTIILFGIISVFGGIIFNFFLFHIELVSTNKTTIDTLEIKRSNLPAAQLNVFDIGLKQNWLQVLGQNKLLWPFPLFGESGRPMGDGVRWERNTANITMTDQNVTNRTQTNQHMRSDMSQTVPRV